MNKNRGWAIGTLTAIVVSIGLNYLVGATSAVGPTNAEVSARYETLLTPAGYAFSIWGVIYLGLVAFGVFQLRSSQLSNPRLVAVRPWVVANMVLNGAWIFAFTAEQITLSFLLIAGLLLTLVLIQHGLRIGKVRVPPAEIWTTRIPFSLYFGWVTAATIINGAIALLHAGYDGGNLGSERWALLLLATGLTIGVFVHARFHNRWYLLALAWAFLGIAQNRGDVPLVAGGAYLASFAAVLAVAARWVPSPGPEVDGLAKVAAPTGGEAEENRWIGNPQQERSL